MRLQRAAERAHPIPRQSRALPGLVAGQGWGSTLPEGLPGAHSGSEGSRVACGLWVPGPSSGCARVLRAHAAPKLVTLGTSGGARNPPPQEPRLGRNSWLK